MAPSTANGILSAVRGVLREAKRLGLMSAEEFDRATDFEPIPGESVAGRHVTRDEMQRFLGYLRSLDTAAGYRDAAMFSVLYATGIRRRECALIDLSDYDGASILIRHAKGAKQRVVYLPTWCTEMVNRWLAWRGSRPGPLLTPCDRHENVVLRTLAQAYIWQTLQRRLAEAGVERFSIHDFRRCFVGERLDEGHDLSRVAAAVGHRSIRTTAGYDRRPLTGRQSMAEGIPSPF